jgi:hypothetical protein
VVPSWLWAKEQFRIFYKANFSACSIVGQDVYLESLQFFLRVQLFTALLLLPTQVAQISGVVFVPVVASADLVTLDASICRSADTNNFDRGNHGGVAEVVHKSGPSALFGGHGVDPRSKMTLLFPF